MTKKTIYELITAEREYQDTKWGEEFDTKNTPNDWIAYITGYAGRASTIPFIKEQFIQRMIEVAALAVAALEQYTYAPRHYDGTERL